MNGVLHKVFAGLVVRRESWCLSLRAKFLVLIMLVCALVMAQRTIYPWLAITKRAPGEYLVVEGWLHGDGFDQAKAEFKRGNYRKILTSGCRATDGSRTETKVTYADWGAERLRNLGISSDLVEPVPCWVERKDRTYHSALAIKKWFQDHQLSPKAINVVSLGPHARRTRLLFQEAFGSDVTVGVIATPDDAYDPLHWWRSSEGVREVVGEGLAYVYARIFFRPGAADTSQPGTAVTNAELEKAYLVGAHVGA
jgi:uncharacterized SAM-binding protein YcdF (DUF218 family)